MVKEFIDAQIKDNKIVVFSKTYCPFCTKAKDAFKKVGLGPDQYVLIEMENRDDCGDIQDYLQKLTGGRTVPRVFINQKFVGGGSELEAMANSGELKKMVQ